MKFFKNDPHLQNLTDFSVIPYTQKFTKPTNFFNCYLAAHGQLCAILKETASLT